ncbi:hypothetical protein [Deinococcus humi]|uniref:Uncharacterized protein n=1 Tax=Deinococcus humi TaxID=662880 RepID=A0A7W8K092_9DEIO|nr:hypothetical protein [Deinococcus humi]MBB5366487.1 hypothetical protein [Deinococcus humi]GGI66872.1 hypothetical protein GCM10008949_53880 [Deinococcus humi]
MVNPAEPVGILVDRKGQVLITESYQYPLSHMWNTIPFSEIPEFQVQILAELWSVAPSGPLE